MPVPYPAAEVAKFAIGECLDASKPINNLKPQKMLYFLWIDYYRKTGRRLFNDEMQAWTYGPVVQAVYWKYRYLVAMPITEREDNILSQKDREILSPMIRHYSEISVGDMISKTHQKGGPWEESYSRGVKHRIDYDRLSLYVIEHGQDASAMDC